MLRQRRREGFWLPEHSPDEILSDDSCVRRERKMSTLVAAVTVLGVWYILHSVALHLKNRLPPMLEIHNGHSEDRFVGENAKVFLEKLAKLGVKVPGSKAVEIDAVNLLEEEITKIINNKNTFNEVTYSQQKAVGSFHLAKPFNFMSVYNNITNLVVKIGPSKENDADESSSLLVNCHYDSAPSSPGASDDGLNCAVMLEVLRVLSQQKYKLNHNIIFLFNGAEETPLQASHAFITQNKWANTVKAFINLESCGAGGKETLFQTGPQHPWLVQMYKEAAHHPFGLVLAEDLFQGGLVPSDTDFRIFRDFGHIPGLDFAHCDNGYVYHTKFDDVDKIEDGVYQHTGDNLLALVQRISSSEILDNTDEYKNGRTIYFDLWGLYLVTYSETFAYIINLAVVIISVFTIVTNVMYYTQDFYEIHKVLEQIIMCVLIPFIGLILSVIFAIVIAVILDYTGSVLSWYSKPYYITLLYFLPTLIAFALPPLRLNAVESSILSDEVKAQLYCNGVQLMWTIGLLIATLTGIRSAYILLIAVLFTAVTNLILWLLCVRYKVKAWLVFFCISSIPSSLYFVYIYLLATQLFVPIAGRSGPNINPELVIGVIAALLCSLIFSYISPLILMVRKPWRIVYGLLIVNVITIFVVIFTSRGFPFAENTPERLLVLHTGRTFYNKAGGIIKSDGGMWLMHIDRRAPETYHEIPWFKNVTDVDSDCSQYIYCGLPFYYTRIASTERNPGSWVPTLPPLLDIDTNLNLTYTENISLLVKRFHFTASGPHQMMFYLSPNQGVDLLNWSFDKESPVKNIKWGERPTYVIHYTAGGYPDSPPFNFYVDLKIPSKSSNLSSYLDIAVSGHYLEDMTKQNTDLMKSYTDSFLKWAHVTTWTALHRSYVF